MIRKAEQRDLDAVEELYLAAHEAEEQGKTATGWIRGIYPTRETARAALGRGDLFVMEEEGRILGSGIINRLQGEAYRGAPWEREVPDEEVCVLHTLVISPSERGKGHGRAFAAFYEAAAAEQGCTELRIDTNARNTAARAMYKKLGYREIAVVPTRFNGIPGVDLVLLEKQG